MNSKRSDLLDAIRLIEAQVVAPGAKFAVAGEGGAPNREPKSNDDFRLVRLH
jgi:hypothetical protein